MKYIINPSGIREDYSYVYGNFAANSSGVGNFTENVTGFALREVITYLPANNPVPVSGKTTRISKIYDQRGNLVQTENYVFIDGEFLLVAWNISEYDVQHRVIRTLANNNLESQAVWGCDNLTSSVAPTGVETEYSYDSQDRLQTLTKIGTNGQANQVTTYRYNLEGKIIETERVADGLSSKINRTYMQWDG